MHFFQLLGPTSNMSSVGLKLITTASTKPETNELGRESVEVSVYECMQERRSIRLQFRAN